METMVLVTDVPMLEPKIIGMAFFTGAPAETKATIIDVEVADDCTATVTRMPIIIPTMGLLNNSEELKSLDKFRPPRIRKEVLRKVKEHMNKYRARRMAKVFKMGADKRRRRPWW
jgi:hypothetical protein